MNITNGEKETMQSIYDSYNSFLFTPTNSVFFKMVKRIELFEKAKNLNGDIVECGVFKGAGMMLWLKLLELWSPHDIRKVIGFDFFDQNFIEHLSEYNDREMMSQVFSRCDTSNISVEFIRDKLTTECLVDHNRFELIKGDISVTSKQYIENRPGFRISLLYMDLDLEEPTYETLMTLWPRVVKGGVVVFDEYAYHAWSESNAVDRFIQHYDLQLCKTNVRSPTAYVIK